MGQQLHQGFYRHLLTAVICALLSMGARSDDLQPLAKPMTESLTPESMLKVGEARLKVLLWSVYDSRLYTPSGSYDDGDRPLRLEIQYLRDIRARDLVDRTLTEWRAMGRAHPDQGLWLEQLSGLWPDIQASDVLTLELDRDGVATFSHNGETLGRLEDPDFGREFVDIWLSRDSTRQTLRNRLVGAAAGNN